MQSYLWSVNVKFNNLIRKKFEKHIHVFIRKTKPLPSMLTNKTQTITNLRNIVEAQPQRISATRSAEDIGNTAVSYCSKIWLKYV